MLILFLIAQNFNPSISLGVLLPEEDTELFFGHLYHFRLENSFTRNKFSPGVFVDLIYKSNDPYNDPHFVNSGIQTAVKAAGGGLSLRYTPHRNVYFDITLGYYVGEMSFPIAEDSGIVSRQTLSRNSLGTILSFQVHEYIGTLRTGIRIYVSLIPFGAKERPDIVWWEQQQYTDLEYASLNSLGVGLTFGIGGKR